MNVSVPKPLNLSPGWPNNMTLYNSDPLANAWRTILGHDGVKPVIVIGLNPSYATDIKSDRTISRIKEYACWHGFDGLPHPFSQPVPRPPPTAPNKSPPVHASNLFYQNIQVIDNQDRQQRSNKFAQGDRLSMSIDFVRRTKVATGPLDSFIL